MNVTISIEKVRNVKGIDYNECGDEVIWGG